MHRFYRGFTIVELLIVIVIIAILAAITIIAYNGIQDRAATSAMSSDLVSVAKRLRLDQTLNGAYPSTLAAANEGKGITLSSSNELRYSVNNSVNPQNFCLTTTNGKKSMMITESTSPSEGGCVNVALGASTSSSILVDGVTTSNPYYGPSSGVLGSVSIDLGSAKDISIIKVWHYYADSRTYHNTKTEISTDNTNWTTVFDSAVSGEYVETSAGKTTTFSLRKVRYIRDWLNGSTSNSSNHWVEIQAF